MEGVTILLVKSHPSPPAFPNGIFQSSIVQTQNERRRKKQQFPACFLAFYVMQVLIYHLHSNLAELELPSNHQQKVIKPGTEENCMANILFRNFFLLSRIENPGLAIHCMIYVSLKAFLFGTRNSDATRTNQDTFHLIRLERQLKAFRKLESRSHPSIIRYAVPLSQ